MEPAGFWRFGRVWSSVWCGLPFGALCALSTLAASGSVRGSVLGGIFAGALDGGMEAASRWKRWRQAQFLSSRDRRTVVRFVRGSKSSAEPRLAPAVLDYARTARLELDRGRRSRWVLWLFGAGGLLAVAIASTVGAAIGHYSTIWWWALLAAFVILVALDAYRRPRLMDRVGRAEAAARRVLAEYGSHDLRERD